MSDRSRPVANLGLAVATLVLCALAAEVSLRAIGYEYSPLHIVVAAGDFRVGHVFEDRHFTYDPELIWKPRSGHDVFNRDGFRGPEFSEEKSPGEFRVFAIGDSNTLGWAGQAGPNWPEYLSEVLARHMEPEAAPTVVNAGVWGYSSHQGLARLRQALAHDPDVVLISFGANDAQPVTFSDAEFAYRRLRKLRLTRVLSKSRLGHVLLAFFNRGRPESAGIERRPRVSLDEYRSNLRQMIAEARTARVAVIMLTRPYVRRIRGVDNWKYHAVDYNAATIEVAVAESVAWVDVYTLFREHQELFVDESHFTEEGHRLAAEAIAPIVAAQWPADEAGAGPGR